MSLFKICADSMHLLGKQPKLFLPKLFVAALNGIAMIVSAQLAMQVLPFWGYEQIPNPVETFVQALLLLFFVCFVLLVDVFTNAMYPTIVKEFFEKKKISFKKAVRHVSPNFFKIFLSIILTAFLLAIPLYLLVYLTSVISNNIFVLALVVVFFLTFYLFIEAALYFIYPLSVIESLFFFENFAKSFELSRKKILAIFVASLVPFSISIINFTIAFFVDQFGFLLLFVFLRFVVGIIQTYHMVLSPSVFLKYKEL